MPKRIVYTRPDGGVAVCAPSHTALRYMTGGAAGGTLRRARCGIVGTTGAI